MFFDNIFSSDKFYYPIENTDDLDLYLLLKKFEQDNNLELECYYDKKYIWLFNPPKKLIASFNKKNLTLKIKEKKSSFKAFNLDEMIIKKIKVIKDPNLELSNQVILKTNDKNIFKKILKNHYYLQKGSLEYFRSDKESIYFIKITNPSYWILFSEYEVGKDLFLYNSVSEKLDTNLKGLYLEYGYKFRDLTLAKKIYLLGGITLLQNQGEISSYDFIWDNYLNLIKLELPEIILEKNNDNEKIIVKPRLVEDNRKIDSVAWLISDIEKLSKILDNINYENLEHFKAFYGEKDIFITSLPSADNNLKNILTDTFEAFYLINKKIYLPINNSLMPRLPERILIEYWDIKEKEIVFLQNKDEEIKITSVSTIKEKKLTDFIEYYLEKKLETFEPFNSSWNFNFQNLKKKPITFQYSVKSENKFLEDKVTPVEIKNTKVENIENRNIKIIDLSSFNKDLEELDKLLANDIHNSSLWYKRSLLNEKRNLYESSFISKCTGLILDKNLDEIFKLLEVYFKKEFNEFSKNNLSEIEKGTFLNKIRSGNLDAEFNFLLELYYSIKFKEKNLFDAITDKMRNGYINSNIEFNEMNDFKLTSVKEKDPSFLNDLSKLKKKFDKILNCFDSNNEEENLLKNLISKQYSSMIEENLSSDSTNIIFGELKEIDYETNINPTFLELIKKHWLYIDNPEKYPIESNETSFLNWKEAFKMKNVKNIPVKDLFTGRVYQRMTFSSDFEEKLSNLTQELHEYYIDGNFAKLNFETVLSEEKKGIKNNDRKELFKAKSQRLLLRTVTDFGASEAFNKLIENFEYNSNFNIVVMNCDIYRLKLIYKHIFSEETFFKALEENLPHYFVDFRDAVENMILCLFLSSTTQKESFLISLCKKTIEKFKESSKTDFFLHEILVLFAYIGATSLLETLPESIAEYNFKERRKSIWMDFTFNIREKFNDYEW